MWLIVNYCNMYTAVLGTIVIMLDSPVWRQVSWVLRSGEKKSKKEIKWRFTRPGFRVKVLSDEALRDLLRIRRDIRGEVVGYNCR